MWQEEKYENITKAAEVDIGDFHRIVRRMEMLLKYQYQFALRFLDCQIPYKDKWSTINNNLCLLIAFHKCITFLLHTYTYPICNNYFKKHIVQRNLEYAETKIKLQYRQTFNKQETHVPHISPEKNKELNWINWTSQGSILDIQSDYK